HTSFSRDWSSDVCSSDLVVRAGGSVDARVMTTVRAPHPRPVAQAPTAAEPSAASDRSPAATEVGPGAQVLGELVRDVLGSIVDLFTGPDAAASRAPPTQTLPGALGTRVLSIASQHDAPA